MTREEFSIRLKQALNDKKMKPLELANKIGTSRANISNYTRGKAFPPLDTLVEIAKTLDVSLDWLCGMQKPETISDVVYMFSEKLYSAPSLVNDFSKMQDLLKNGEISKDLYCRWPDGIIQKIDREK